MTEQPVSSPSGETDVENFADVVTLGEGNPLVLDSGEMLGAIEVAYKTWGRLNADKSNAILICHALTGDHYVCGTNPITGKGGWWENMVGPGKPVDTDRYYIICSNVLGSCAGTTGPASLNPITGKAYGPDFPVITLGDMVRAQALLLDHLGIDTLFSVIGGSMGGMQTLQWAAAYPDRVKTVVAIATTWRHSAQNIAFHEVGRQAIMADVNWAHGRYMDDPRAEPPHAGLAVARMAAHITYMSESGLTSRFGRNLQDRDKVAFGFDADFQIESYLRHQGISFVDRFDANSYLYITRAMDYYDLSAPYDGVLAEAFRETKTRFCVISFTSDWLYTTEESRHIVRSLNAVGARVSFANIDMDKGHDSFLLDCPEMNDMVAGFLQSEARSIGVNS
ncbi:homoserine O-acetyltransferase MetX [Paremcibacter congregatus]|uniref:Homoserine O-acetyltransferase n=1 Tax=Paremcibacter congregatus TaxID=2043170 RepID=A0A2G4YPV4_9PROT|nr:homoserine O-acetyltransferase [Paremcibacter congregatus]PHZ84362.1 homoserine O-acetyltransferase [Paremcibacter congregatus]QDE28582.1 homoserine O-acetyltransferase [Paremcibacter congregatus]